MQTTTLVFPYNVRLTYTAIRAWFQQKQTQFSSIEFNDSLVRSTIRIVRPEIKLK